jgi:hypothetical protein
MLAHCHAFLSSVILLRGFEKRVAEEKKLDGARRLLLKTNTKGLTKEDVASMSFTELRDQLLHVAPTDSKHVRRHRGIEGLVHWVWFRRLDWRDSCVCVFARKCRCQALLNQGIDCCCPQVAKVNQVEAAYWKMSSGYRLDESTHILGFDCGGQQWVLEVRPHRKRRRRRWTRAGMISLG